MDAIAELTKVREALDAALEIQGYVAEALMHRDTNESCWLEVEGITKQIREALALIPAIEEALAGRDELLKALTAIEWMCREAPRVPADLGMIEAIARSALPSSSED